MKPHIGKNWKIHCDDHSSLSSITAVQNGLFHIFHITGNYVRSDTCSNGWFHEFDGKKKNMLNSTVFIVGPAGRRYNSGSTTVH